MLLLLLLLLVEPFIVVVVVVVLVLVLVLVLHSSSSVAWLQGIPTVGALGDRQESPPRRSGCLGWRNWSILGEWDHPISDNDMHFFEDSFMQGIWNIRSPSRVKSSRRPGTNAFTPIRQSSSTRASGGKGNKRINRKVFFFRRGPFFFWGGCCASSL